VALPAAADNATTSSVDSPTAMHRSDAQSVPLRLDNAEVGTESHEQLHHQFTV
jgi:hypothetical protein